jgi:hypothetical protein
MVQILVIVTAVGLVLIAVRQTVLWKVIVAETEHVLHQTHVAVTRVGKETAHAQHILAMG